MQTKLNAQTNEESKLFVRESPLVSRKIKHLSEFSNLCIMVFILRQEISCNNNLILSKDQMTNCSSGDCEESYECSSKQIFNNNNENELTHRKSGESKRYSETKLESSPKASSSEPESNNKKLKVNIDIAKMNENNMAIPNNPTVTNQAQATLLASIEHDSSDCYKLQGEFRSRGWNVAGANILAVSCWIAKSQFLYARPRLTGLDFIIAAIITTACGILARYEWF